jgi:hypothetical protein
MSERTSAIAAKTAEQQRIEKEERMFFLKDLCQAADAIDRLVAEQSIRSRRHGEDG